MAADKKKMTRWGIDEYWGNSDIESKKEPRRHHRWLVDTLCGEENMDILLYIKRFEIPCSERGFFGPKYYLLNHRPT